MILHGNLQDVFMNQVCLFVCVRGSVHPILPKKLYLHCFRVLRADICPLQDDYGIYPYPLTLQRQLAVQGRDFCAERKLVFFSDRLTNLEVCSMLIKAVSQRLKI